MLLRNLARMLFIAALPLSWAAQSQKQVGLAAAQADYGNLPLTFELNQGQASPSVRFLSRNHGYTLYLTSQGMSLGLHPNYEPLLPAATPRENRQPQQRVELRLVGSLKTTSVIGEDPQPGRVNYFFGNDPSRWRTNVPTYGKVRYKDVYPGVDLVYYGNHRQLEYDFEVRPGANPQSIEFEIHGATQVEMDDSQNLVLQVGRERLTFASPVVYQVVNNNRVPVVGHYALKDATHVGFQLANYDANSPLVIDPVLLYSTYLGGSSTDTAQGIAVDAAGNAYIAGSSDSVDFPLTSSSSLTNGSLHVFVSKLDATGTNLLFTDYFGGDGQDVGYAIALDQSNDILVSGSTSSGNFPTVAPYQGTYRGVFNAFLTKITPDGSSLLYSTYLGGNGVDVPTGIAVDAANAIIVGGYTSSTNFPVANAFQPTTSSNQGGVYGSYGFLTKFSPDGSTLTFSTYLAGKSNVVGNCGGTPCWPQPTTIVNGIAVDPAGNVYAGGFTNTYDFPTTAGAFLTSNSTSQNADVGFLSKLNASGTLQYSTYFYESSGQLTDVVAVVVDGAGSAFVTGMAVSDGTFPLTSTSICNPATYGTACSYGFVTKFDPTGSSLAYSTFLGPDNFAIPRSIVLDTNDDAYVLSGSPTASFNIVNGIESYSGGNDLLLEELDATGSSQLLATYLGGSLDEYPAGIDLDSSNNLYVAGYTDSTDLPTTIGAFQLVEAGNFDVFVMKIAPAASPAVTLSPGSLQFGSQTIGSISAAQSILLRNMGSAPLAISSVNVTGDFRETDNCIPSVPAASSCSFSVSFAPAAVGQRAGTLAILDDAAGSPHTISLSGSGLGAVATLAPQALNFPLTALGNSSAQQTVTLTNSGNMALNVAGIQASGDYSQTNNCPTPLGVAASCSISVTFTPTASGSRTGTLSFNDSTSNSPQTVSLSGTGGDFGLSATPSSVTVKSGSSALYQLTATSVGGSFPGAVSLSCDTLPSNAICSYSPVSITPTGVGATAKLTITTNGNNSSAWMGRSGSSHFYACWLQLSGLGLFGLVYKGSKQTRCRVRILALCIIAGSMFTMTACAGGTGIGPQGSGTPAGTYTITVNGTAGSLQHSLTLKLVVQ